MIIRPATVWDAENITKLWSQMYKEITTNASLLEEVGSDETLFISVVTRTKLPDWCILVAEENNEIFGFMMALARWPDYSNCHVIGHVEALYVVPEKRGTGLYNSLIEKMYEWGDSKNINHVQFMSKNDPKIQKLYSHLGYEPVQFIYRKKEV